MTRLAPIAALAAAFLLGAVSLADEGGNDQFEPVDPASLETVSGTTLTIAAYAIIVGAIVLYCLILMLRERGIHRSIRRLDQKLNRQTK